MPAQPDDPPAADAAIAAAESQLAAGRPTACLTVLAALPPERRQQLRAHRLQALCQIQLAGSTSAVSGAWWQVFGLEAASATAASVRRQYKRLAALVHPDKCRLEGAAEGFKRLRAAADSLLEAVSGSGPPAKRARAERSGSGAAAAAADDAELSSGEEEEDGWVPNGGGFPWWSQWESVQPPRGASAGAACAAQLISSANQQQQQQGDAGGKGTGAGQDEEQAEERQLQGMALEELRAEVRRRQVAILEPALDAQGQRVPLQQLQAALRRARTVLADRVAAAAAVKAAEGGGGFLV